MKFGKILLTAPRSGGVALAIALLWAAWWGFFVTAAAVLTAQVRPDISGVWKLRSARARYSEVYDQAERARHSHPHGHQG